VLASIQWNENNLSLFPQTGDSWCMTIVLNEKRLSIVTKRQFRLFTSLARWSYSPIRFSFSWLIFSTLQIRLAAVSAYIIYITDVMYAIYVTRRSGPHIILGATNNFKITRIFYSAIVYAWNVNFCSNILYFAGI